ncbi:hypothetical protein PYCC9005_002394 [Savitreella phatthalungensis]
MDTIRPIIQSVTRNLPPVVSEQLVLLLGSQKCYKSIVENVNLQDIDCLKLCVSKGLGIGIVLAACVVKVPQILKIVRSRSGEGVSVLSYLLETTAFLITLAYNVRQGFAFSTYGETLFILLQNVVVTILVLFYANRGFLAGLVLGGLSLGGFLLFGSQDSEWSTIPEALWKLLSFGGKMPLIAAPGQPFVSNQDLQYLATLTIPLSLASKIPQILTIARQRSTGQLSAFAVFNYLAGSLARVFTTAQEVKDPVLLWGFILGAALNAVLAFQTIIYWNNSGPVKRSIKEKRAAGKTK